MGNSGGISNTGNGSVNITGGKQKGGIQTGDTTYITTIFIITPDFDKNALPENIRENLHKVATENTRVADKDSKFCAESKKLPQEDLFANSDITDMSDIPLQGRENSANVTQPTTDERVEPPQSVPALWPTSKPASQPAPVSESNPQPASVALKPKVVLSEKQVKKPKEDEARIAEIVSGKDFSVICTGTNKGGLTAELGTFPVFVPRHEIRIGYVSDLEKYVGKTLRLKLIEIQESKSGKIIIASQRIVLEAEQEVKEAAKVENEANFFANIHVGDVVEGKVERITSFGAFVSVNGFDCLAHISDLRRSGVKEVTDVLELGKRYQFEVLKVDRDSKTVSIGYKQLQPQPWDLAAEKYAEGDIVHGKVVRIVPFGAFVELEKGIDGLVHVSQITHEWLENPTTALTIGEEVDAKILAFNPAEHKITLSIKALTPIKK